MLCTRRGTDEQLHWTAVSRKALEQMKFLSAISRNPLWLHIGPEVDSRGLGKNKASADECGFLLRQQMQSQKLAQIHGPFVMVPTVQAGSGDVMAW